MISAKVSLPSVGVPFFRPLMTDAEIGEVVDTLRSGWLTTGPKVKRLEKEFAAAVNARYAVALNSCTAALHLAAEALQLTQGQGVLVPTMTFAATAEIVRYLGAIPILVDCDVATLNIDLQDAEQKIQELRSGKLLSSVRSDTPIVGIIPVHVGGMMIDGEMLQDFASRYDLWLIEDAAHAFPAARRSGPNAVWQQCGEGTASVSCFSFYANKTITTGEGGMAVTNDPDLAGRIRMMSLHGLSQDAWNRYSGGGWDYRIAAPGYKYNLTDIAASIGIHQLARAEGMRSERERIAKYYLEALAEVAELELPLEHSDRIHSRHLFPIRLRLDQLSIDRNRFVEELKAARVGCSVHWRPLHLHPYYQENFGWRPDSFPVASAEWKRLISLPIYPGMRDYEIEYVVNVVKRLCTAYAR